MDKSVVLLSGGFPHNGTDVSQVLPDELYNIKSQTVVKVLDLQQSLRRAEHALVKMGDKILAFGGRDSNNNVPNAIEEFNTESNSWSQLSQKLHSTNTSELTASPFPTSALDCVPQCRCGEASSSNRQGRIFGGTEAEVSE